MKHELKTLPKYFQPSWIGAKSFETRINDRNFRIYDEVVLAEYYAEVDEYTGREIEGVITYIAEDFQKEGYVTFQIDVQCRRE